MEPSNDVICKLDCIKDNICGKNSAFLAMFSCDSFKRNDVKFCFRSYENSQTPDGLERKRTRKILVADSGKLQYCGYNYGNQASQRGEQCRYYVGVRNKKTGVMTVHGIQQIHCIPHLDSTVSVLEDDDSNEEKTYIEKMDRLTSAFGSKRKRQAMESRLNYGRGNGGEGDAVADSVELSALRINESTNEASGLQKAQAIPPQNASATAPDQVYDLKDIISMEEYFAIDHLAKVLTEATSEQIQLWKSESLYGQLVLQNLQRTSLDLEKAKLLVYYNFLIQLVKLIAQDVKKKDPLPKVPEPFKTSILERFTISGSTQSGGKTRTMPLAMKDKTMAYAMVLALFIEGYRIELSVLETDFKKGRLSLEKIANALGCTVLSQKKNGVTVKVAELRLPLFVPTKKTFAMKR